MDIVSISLYFLVSLWIFAFLGSIISNTSKNQRIYFLLILIPFLVILALRYYFTTPGINLYDFNVEKFGQFGDAVGGLLNPILAFMTVILLVISIKEQRTANENFKIAEHKSLHKEATINLLETLKKEFNEEMEKNLMLHTNGRTLDYTFGLQQYENFSLRDVLNDSFGQHYDLSIIFLDYFSAVSDNKTPDEEINNVKISELANIVIINKVRTLRELAENIFQGYEEIARFQETKFLKLRACNEWSNFLRQLMVFRFFNNEEWVAHEKRIDAFKNTFEPAATHN